MKTILQVDQTRPGAAARWHRSKTRRGEKAVRRFERCVRAERFELTPAQLLEQPPRLRPVLNVGTLGVSCHGKYCTASSYRSVNVALHVGAARLISSTSCGGRSSSPVSWRISSTSSKPRPVGARRAHSTASSSDATSIR